MDKKHKRYLKLNLMSLFFAGVSFISITLAWFAYSGLVTTSTEINVKAWRIAFTKNEQAVSNNIVISLTDIYPGMQTISETIDIKNLGDSAAALSYEITSARILDDEIESNGEEGYVEDILSHNYPFHINMSLSDSYVDANDGVGQFTVSVSWPLDSGNDKLDSEWGTKAYEFQKNEADKNAADSTYQPLSALKIEINLKAAQYLGTTNTTSSSTSGDTALLNSSENNASTALDETDPDYKLGSIVLYNPAENTKCTSLDETNCLKTYIIDKDNKLSDTSVTLLPDLYGTFKTATAAEYKTKTESFATEYKTTSRPLTAEDVLSIVSKDVLDTIVITPKYSSEIVGYLDYSDRLTNHINKVIEKDGIYRFRTLNFPYFSTTNCIWLNTKYNDAYQFALGKLDDTYTKIYNEPKTSTCSVVPIFEVAKKTLEK